MNPAGEGRVSGKHQGTESYPCGLNLKSLDLLGTGFNSPDLCRVVLPRRRTCRHHENQKRRFEVRRQFTKQGEEPLFTLLPVEVEFGIKEIILVGVLVFAR